MVPDFSFQVRKWKMNLVRERQATNPIYESTECYPVQENTNKGGQSELQTVHAHLSWWKTRIAERIDVQGQDQIAC